MISRLKILAGTLLSIAGLWACGDPNTIEEGLSVRFAEVHSEARPGAIADEASVLPSSDSVTGGYDQANLEKHPIRDVNGRVLSLYRAYLVLDELQLLPCASLVERFLDSLIPTAQAHAGHGSEPIGGRALDKPNVIDIVTQEGFVLPLGGTAIAPGRYCGLRVAMVRLASEAYGKPEFAPASGDDPVTVPEVPEMAGRIFAIRADYCNQINATGECSERIRVDVDDGGLPQPLAMEFDFDQPVELSDTIREVYIVVGIAHGEWVNDLDVTRLESDANERQKLQHNIAASIYVNARGLGDLPINVAL